LRRKTAEKKKHRRLVVGRTDVRVLGINKGCGGGWGGRGEEMGGDRVHGLVGNNSVASEPSGPPDLCNPERQREGKKRNKKRGEGKNATYVRP
jgi:hypothetical protein